MKVLERPDPVDTRNDRAASAGVIIGELIALTGDGTVPLVTLPGDSRAVAARSTVDLRGAHIGRSVVVTFEDGERQRPIVLGVLPATGWPVETPPGHVEVEADGQRFIVTAKDELVFRCGKASITLTKAGKVLIQGTYVSSRSSGVNRLKGGSIQLN